MKIKIDSLLGLCLSFFGIVLSNSQVIISRGMNNELEYLSYFLLLACIFYEYVTASNTNWIFRKFFLFVFILFLFCVGIILQPDLPTATKIYLSISMFIIAVIMCLSEGIITSVVDYRKIGYTLFFATLVTTLLGAIFRVSMFTLAVEGTFSSFGFNGGMDHKNYYAITLFCSFILIYINDRFGVKHSLDKFILFSEVLLIFLSNSRTVYLLLVLFIAIISITYLRKIKSNQRALLLLLIIVSSLMFSLVFYLIYISNSASYAIRLKGLFNYMRIYSQDTFHLFFGNATMGFSGGDASYTDRVRAVIGWDGTVELSILSVLIKNGYLGLSAYLIMMISYLFAIFKKKNFYIRIIGLSLWLTLLFSAFVENYIVNIHIVYMAVVFCLLSSILYLDINEERFNYEGDN